MLVFPLISGIVGKEDDRGVFSEINASGFVRIDRPKFSEFVKPAAQRRLKELLHNGPIRIVPHGRDVSNRLLADVFVNEQNAVEILKMEGFAKSG